MGIFFECMHRETMKFMWRIGRNNQKYEISRELYMISNILGTACARKRDQTLNSFEKLPTPHKL